MLPPFCSFYCSSCRRSFLVYPTVRLGAALMLRIWWIVHFLQLSARCHGYYHQWCWTESRPISCCLLANRYYRYLQTYASKTSLDVVAIPPPSFTRSPSAALPPQKKTTCLPLRKRSIRGRVRSFTRPNRDAHETGRARSRSRDSRQGEPPEAGFGNETGDGAPYHHPDPSTKTVESPVREEKKTDQSPPDSRVYQRQISPAPDKRHQLPPLRGRPGTIAANWTLRARQSAARRADRGAHAGASGLAYAAAGPAGV